MPMERAADAGDFFITATGVCDVITLDHMRRMKDGAIMANAGHFFDEIAVEPLRKAAVERLEARENLSGYRLPSGAWVYLMADGKIVNISAADGHPAEIMDTSFALQALSAEYAALQRSSMSGTTQPAVIPVPQAIDREVARLKLESVGVTIDRLSERQRAYLADVAK